MANVLPQTVSTRLVAGLFRLPPFLREPGDVYRSRRRENLTSHQLADYRFCPRYHKRKAAGLVPERSGEDYTVGAAAHCLILEGKQRFDQDYHVGGPINPKTEKPYGEETKAFREWAAQQTKTVLSEDQYALVCQLLAAVRSHVRAAELLDSGIAEGVLRTKIVGVPCQIRADWFTPDFGLVDLKTCYSLDSFPTDTEAYHYVEQMAFYRRVLRDFVDEDVPVRLIAVEKREPFRCGVWLLSPHKLDEAERQNFLAILDLAESRRADHWPTGYESERVIG